MSSKTLENKRVGLHSLGCKVNSYESQVMISLLKDAGCEIVDFEDVADIYIVNTCSVTNIADRKSRQMLHKAKKLNPDALIVAAGCYVQGRGMEEVLEDGVDLAIGNDNKSRIIELMEEYFDHGKRGVVEDLCCSGVFEEMELRETDERTRAYIKVEDGCDQFCSYCLIPYLRGRVRSRDVSDIIREIEGFDGAYPEIVLTGINLSAYGKDIAEAGGTLEEGSAAGTTETEGTRQEGVVTDLLSLTRRICEIPTVKRIRISSLEPRIVTREFAAALAAMEKVCPHFHLSLQSGCDRTLKRMNRHYTAKEYMEAVERLRSQFSEKRGAPPAITTDVIVGFPGESMEDFRQCEEFLEKIGLYETHIFKYSVRKGTAAAKLEGQLTDREKSFRSARLIDLGKENRRRFIDGLIANETYTPELLVEESVEIDGKTFQAGYTAEYVKAVIASDEDLTGRIVKGRLEWLKQDICIMRQFEVK